MNCETVEVSTMTNKKPIRPSDTSTKIMAIINGIRLDRIHRITGLIRMEINAAIANGNKTTFNSSRTMPIAIVVRMLNKTAISLE